MGLDVTAYSHLKAIGKHYTGNWCEDDDHVTAYAYKAFPLSFLGLPVLEERDEFVVGGCYATTEATETLGFHAGSYGGYNQWRAALQDKYNPDRLETEPFFELIWFADNEGSIGPVAAAELLRDFDIFAIEGRMELGEPFGLFHDACKLAAQDGLIDFH